MIKCDLVKSLQQRQQDEAHYLGAVVPDGFVLQLTILFTVGETWEIR